MQFFFRKRKSHKFYFAFFFVSNTIYKLNLWTVRVLYSMCKLHGHRLIKGINIFRSMLKKPKSVHSYETSNKVG